MEIGMLDPYLGLFANRLVNNIVVLHHLLLHSVRQVLHACVLLLQVYVAQTPVEQDLARVKLEQEPQLCIVYHGVAAKIEERVVEVGKCLFEVAEQEIGHALLEVGNREVLIEPDGTLVAFDLRELVRRNSSRVCRRVRERAWHALLDHVLPASHG